MKTLLALLLLIPSLSWGLDKDELKEELKYWKSLLDDELISQKDYDYKKEVLLNSKESEKKVLKKTNSDSSTTSQANNNDNSNNNLASELDGLMDTSNSNSNSEFEVKINTHNIINAQSHLKELGYYKSHIDGVAGPKTILAMKEWLKDNNRSENGFYKKDYSKLMSVDVFTSNKKGFVASHIVKGTGLTHSIWMSNQGLFLDTLKNGTELMSLGSAEYKDFYFLNPNNKYMQVKTATGTEGIINKVYIRKLTEFDQYSNMNVTDIFWKPTHYMKYRGSLKDSLSQGAVHIRDLEERELVMKIDEYSSGHVKVKSYKGEVGYLDSYYITENLKYKPSNKNTFNSSTNQNTTTYKETNNSNINKSVTTYKKTNNLNANQNITTYENTISQNSFEKRCQNLGLTKGTSDYVNCVIDLENLEIQKQANKSIQDSNNQILRQAEKQNQILLEQQQKQKKQKQSEALIRMGNYLLNQGRPKQRCMFNPVGWNCY